MISLYALIFLFCFQVSGDIEVQHSGDPSGKCGGWITFPFIIAILADSFFGDIPVILASTFIYLLGISLLTLIAFSDYLRPRPCEPGSILCQSPSDLQLGILYVVLALVTTGTAGTRVALASAGANQYEKPKDQGTFFNCYFLMVNTGAIISATEIVYTQDNASWKLGFGLCAAANLISFVLFISGKRLYKHNKPMVLGIIPNIDEMKMRFRQLRDLRRRLLIFRKGFTTKILFLQTLSYKYFLSLFSLFLDDTK
ncbi:protein NRT1/ PTR FAMILY 2.3-like [Brassica napus]|uniref:protein NRT1/ PTR FAMILY 2.3-like n=1 Tax=Brassica napus TaxID=3708 RepID=UPI00207945A6|nr:protein NRT1/ PTR FAMILY 2.3-like [Brassica napus]